MCPAARPPRLIPNDVLKEVQQGNASSRRRLLQKISLKEKKSMWTKLLQKTPLRNSLKELLKGAVRCEKGITPSWYIHPCYEKLSLVSIPRLDIHPSSGYAKLCETKRKQGGMFRKQFTYLPPGQFGLLCQYKTMSYKYRQKQTPVSTRRYFAGETIILKYENIILFIWCLIIFTYTLYTEIFMPKYVYVQLLNE